MGGRASRNEASTVLFAETLAPASFVTAVQFSIMSASIASAVIAICIAVVTWALRREWKRRRIEGKTSQLSIRVTTLREILLFLLFSLLFPVVSLCLHGLALSWRACSILGTVPLCMYGLSRFFCYRVLLLRVKSVEKVMPDWSHVLLLLVRIGAHGGLGPIIVTAVLFTSGKTTFEEQIYTQQMEGLLPVVGAFMDIGLTGSLLVLFVIPVFHESNRVALGSDSTVKTTLVKAAWRNLVLSSISIFSSNAYLLGIGITTPRLAGNDSASVQHLRLYTTYGGTLDVLCNACVIVSLYWRLIFDSNPRTRRVANCSPPPRILIKRPSFYKSRSKNIRRFDRPENPHLRFADRGEDAWLRLGLESANLVFSSHEIS